MKTVEIIKMPKGYYVKSIYGAHIKMQWVKTEKEAKKLQKEWKA